MAIVTTTFTPDLTVFPWSDTDAPDPGRRGIRPLGELVAVVLDGAVGAPGAGDNQHVSCNVTLPDNFQYILTDAMASVVGIGLAAADNWEAQAGLIVFDLGGTPTPLKEFAVGMSSVAPWQLATSFVKAWRPDDPLPTYLLNGGTFIETSYTNLTDDDIAVVFNFVFRFLTYTVAQQFDAGVNTPLLVR